MTERGPSKDDYVAAVFNAVNYGMNFNSAQEADLFVRMHLEAMAQEKASGYPNGPLVWTGFMQLLKDAIRRRDYLREKERHSDSVWTPYVIK